ncbi:MAG: nucleoside 2-deoxyribosyltransferase [Ignavibacteriales bacterium]|nr:nucleoside 2-deoxyribosyltransferase [Ignavibacteriales bacterium]
MIIYCAGPIRGNTTYQENYSEIVRIVESTGHTALSEVSTKFSSSIPLSAKQIYTRDIKWIDGSKLLIAEVSGPSLGVGFEVAYALLVKKIPVLAVYQEQAPQISSMVAGCGDPKLQVKKYSNIDDLTSIVKNFIVTNGGN